MRVGFAFIMLLAACAAGCLPVPSLYPLVEEEQGIAVPEIVGTWGDSSQTVRFDLEHGARYTMTNPDSADSTERFRVLFARFGGRLFADMVADPRSLPGGDPSPWLWPMHLVYRVDVAGDSLRLGFLDDKWVKGALARHQLKARHEMPEEDVVLTEKTAGLQAMVRKIANVDAAFDTSATFMRRR
jgi:hypothetical protein